MTNLKIRVATSSALLTALAVASAVGGVFRGG